MSQEEGSVSKEKQEEFEKDRKRAIKEMIDSRKFYIPHKKLNEKISVKAFSQEGEEEMVVFDEIRLDQGPTPRSIEKRLSIKDFYNTYVTFSRKAKVDGSQGESLNEDLDKDLSDVLLQGEIDQLEQEKKVLEKTSTSFEGIGKKMKELARIKDEIERLQNKRDELCGTSTRSATIEEFKRKIKEMEVIDERMAVLKSGNVGVEIEESKEVIEKDAFTLKESLEKIQSLDELITFIEGNENGVQQYIKQETENKPSVEALRYLRNILGDDSLSPDEKTRRCAEELRKETSFPKITNEVGLFKRTKELIQNVLKEERKRLEGDANVDAKTFKNEEESETIPEVEEFKEVKEEIQGVQSFEEIYEILGKYKDNISGDIDTGMSYEDVFGQIQNAYEGFKSSAKDNFIDRNHLVIPQTLPKVIFFKDEEIILSHTFWRNIFTAELDRIQKESVDREN
ncbi:MAG: hypothetical protein EOM19_03790, partial [Candidatus Moranbacteria bacterium]|nr:hypothetical protein [Candidatus Moranbacteria bacterium]